MATWLELDVFLSWQPRLPALGWTGSRHPVGMIRLRDQDQ
jgi:hypothetical protein